LIISGSYEIESLAQNLGSNTTNRLVYILGKIIKEELISISTKKILKPFFLFAKKLKEKPK
jgi:hypothetical protein